ncbi:MAG: restriction endonuclease subunit S, partial [Bacteroidales bacterium]|nr:restriction endonuclease subunit S [Bacteroidales bacterium]
MNGKQLKNSILQWAIQGKLVPQDPNDEPAAVLLERIRAEKKRLIKEGKIKKDKNESIIYRGDDNSYYEKFPDGRVVCIDDEIPFEIPAGWEWCRLRDVCEYIQRGKSPIYSEVKKYPVIAQKCNQWTGFSIEKAQFIDPETVTKYSEERVLRDKDLLWNSTGLGTLGRIAVYLSKKNPYGWAVADSHVTVIRPLKAMAESYFLYAYFASPTVQSVIEDKAEGSTKQKELYVDTIKEYLIPFPPISEQKRIIKKIDEVLPEVFKYGKSQERLDSLNSELKDKIKKSILQEAIQGRLLPQDPNDEPASALLDRIRIEKQKLLKEGKLKTKDIVESSIFKGEDNKYYEKVGNNVLNISEEIPFEIPDSWQWVRLGYLFAHNTGKALNR